MVDPRGNSASFRTEGVGGSLLHGIFDLNCCALTFTMGRLMHTNPTLQLIRLATHPTLTQISENTGFSEIDLLMIEIINCVIVYLSLLIESQLKSKHEKLSFFLMCCSILDRSCVHCWSWCCCSKVGLFFLFFSDHYHKTSLIPNYFLLLWELCGSLLILFIPYTTWK